MFRRLASTFHGHGPYGVLRAVQSRFQRRPAASFAAAAPLLRGRAGLEIGGPSAIFRAGGLFPAYPLVARLDNCNFSSSTIWEGDITEGATFVFDDAKPAGRQFIAEASELAGVPEAAYDLLLSSHTIEHVANPLGTLARWKAVLRSGGTLVLVVPHRDGTFDRRRPLTTLGHLAADLAAGTAEDDLTHLPETLALHDFSLHPVPETRAAFEARLADNLAVRGMHHHTFDIRLVATMLDLAGFALCSVETEWPFHILAVATVPDGTPDNAAFLAALPDARRSPFATDRA